MNTSVPIDSLIHSMRGHKVLLDVDLAALYGVPTKRLNEAVKRNSDRFPIDFMFQLTSDEWAELKARTALNTDPANRSQIATGSQKHRDPRYLPRAFTEHGAIMAATVLNSAEAVAMSVYVVRAFVQMREQISANVDVLRRLAEIDKTLLKHDKSLQIIWTQLQPLLAPPQQPPRKRIGFQTDDK